MFNLYTIHVNNKFHSNSNSSVTQQDIPGESINTTLSNGDELFEVNDSEPVIQNIVVLEEKDFLNMITLLYDLEDILDIIPEKKYHTKSVDAYRELKEGLKKLNQTISEKMEEIVSKEEEKEKEKS